MTVLELQERIDMLNGAIDSNKYNILLLTNTIKDCKIKNCFTCDFDRQGIEEMQQANIELASTVAFLEEEKQRISFPRFIFNFTSNETAHSLTIQAIDAYAAIQQFITNYHDNAVLTGYNQIFE